MSDYFTQFSEGLALTNREQVDWCRAQLDAEKLLRLREEAADHYAVAGKIVVPDWAKDLVLAEHILNGEDADFQWEIVEENGQIILNMYAEENCDIDGVLEFVQQFLKKFAPDHHFTMTWASTCSRMETGGFGGGAAFITADKIDYINTHEWAGEKMRTAGPPSNVKE